MSSSLLTSVGTAMTVSRPCGDAAATFATAVSSACSERSAKHTLRPIAAKRLAAARPIPLAAPVTTATRPSVNAGCVLIILLRAPWRIQVHRNILSLREAVEHAFQRELTPNAALLEAAVRMARLLTETLVHLYPGQSARRGLHRPIHFRGLAASDRCNDLPLRRIFHRQCAA